MSTVTTETRTDVLYLSRLRLNLRHPRIMRSLGDAQALHQLVMSLFPAMESEAARAAMAILYRVDEAPVAPGHATPDTTIRNLADTDPILIVQATVAPRLVGTDRGAGPDAGPAWAAGMLRDDTGPDDALATRDVGPVFAAITVGQRLGFRLRANPTKRLSLSRPDDPTYLEPDKLLKSHREKADRIGKGTGPRVALLKPDEQVQWLVRQGARHGFALVPQERTWTARVDPGAPAAPDAPSFVLTTASARTGGARGRQRVQLTHNAVTFDGELTVTDADAFRIALRTGIGPAKAYGFGLLSVRSPR